ncbi:thioesterase family protein [Telmatospirillum siberiense]|uniref:Thioesterase n=1 Tax=Telmatospirillum siberiense TaxID=382514 RepID=A0A2N3PU70_9PROT|nr:thioesterase family protein [Telmatospirillum siberiense]PKU23954.1 thioesterase [Telmatospirillum siberiense]
MRASLLPGLSHSLLFTVPRGKTVPFLYPESPFFAAMPEVFATGFMVGLMEWCCIEAIAPHLDPGEGSLGVLVEVTHEAATPPGMAVTVDCRLERIDGRRLLFSVEARDERDVIGRGRHARSVVLWDRFNARLADKAAGRA